MFDGIFLLSLEVIRLEPDPRQGRRKETHDGPANPTAAPRRGPVRPPRPASATRPRAGQHHPLERPEHRSNARRTHTDGPDGARQTQGNAKATARSAAATGSSGREDGGDRAAYAVQRTKAAATQAERAVLIPVGAALVARDNVVETVQPYVKSSASRSARSTSSSAVSDRPPQVRASRHHRAQPVQRQVKSTRTHLERLCVATAARPSVRSRPPGVTSSVRSRPLVARCRTRSRRSRTRSRASPSFRPSGFVPPSRRER